MRLLISLIIISPMALANVTSVKVDEAISYSKFSPVEKKTAVPTEEQRPVKVNQVEEVNNVEGEMPVDMPARTIVDGVQILQGTVNDNIIRIASVELGIPEENVDFLYIPCPLVEKYSYVVPESKFTNKYERLTYYASKYSFFATFNEMTNTVTLEYRGPDVFETCRKQK